MKANLKSSPRRSRLVPRGAEDKPQIVRSGHRVRKLDDIYARLLDTSWRELLGIVIVVYLLINLLFALAYLATEGGIDNARPGSFADAFFFSVQTLSTIGYGKMAPNGLAANLLVTAEVITGFSFFAVVTGLMFSKFSRPTARVLFSNVAVIGPYNGQPHLMLRLANERDNRIVDARIGVTMLRKETSAEGAQMRRFHDLNLVRSRLPMLQLSWTVMHPIDETSPLYHATEESLRENDAEIIVSLTGLDETFSQIIHARHSYIDEDIICSATFVDIITRGDDGRIDVNYRLFHDTMPL